MSLVALSLPPLAQFGDPSLLALLLAGILAGGISLRILRWRARQVTRLLDRGGGRILAGADPRRGLWKFGLICLVVVLLAIAIARPQFGARTRPLEQQGVAMVVALDASLSMAAQDTTPNRMLATQTELAALLDRMSGDRVGLVIYAGEALVRFPLTRDLKTARAIIDTMRPGERALRPGTDVAAAITQSLALLETTPARTRVILLVGDGESLSGDALAAARVAAAADVHIFTAGAGSEAGATIPVVNRNTGQTVDKIDARSGEPIVTRLDSAALAALADRGGGRFVRLDQPGALSDLAADFDALEASRFAVTTERRPRERFQIALALALALLLIEPLIAARPPRRAAPVAARAPSRLRRRLLFAGLLPVVALAAASCGDFAAERNAAGTAAFDEGRFDDAATAYREALAASPGDPRLAMNLARALHALEEYDAAIDATRRALAGDDDALAARAYYQLGVHHFEREDLVAARSAYIEALLIEPSDIDAKLNLEIVNTLLAALAPPPGDDGAPGDSDEPGSEGGSGDEGSGGGDGSSPVDTAPGRPAGRAPVPGADDSGIGYSPAQEALRDAIRAFDRNNPSPEAALAILDALRAIEEARRSTLGLLDVEVAGQDDY